MDYHPITSSQRWEIADALETRARRLRHEAHASLNLKRKPLPDNEPLAGSLEYLARKLKALAPGGALKLSMYITDGEIPPAETGKLAAEGGMAGETR